MGDPNSRIMSGMTRLRERIHRYGVDETPLDEHAGLHEFVGRAESAAAQDGAHLRLGAVAAQVLAEHYSEQHSSRQRERE